MKQIIAILLTALALAGVAGCNMPTKQQAKQEAYGRWYDARAKVLVGVGEDQFTAGDLANARNSAREALSLVPGMPVALLLAARVEIEDGNYNEATQYLDLAGQKQETAKIVYLKAVVAERRRDYETALTLYEKARALEPNNPAHVLAAAEVLATMGKPLDGLELIESKMDQLDQGAGLHKAAGELAMLAGKPDKAAEHFQQARLQQGDDVDLQESLARAYFFAGQYDKAVLTINDLLKQEKYARTAWVHSMLGESYMALNRPREARGCFERTTEIEKSEPRHWVNLAKAALASKDAPRAIMASREALGLQPNLPEASMLLGYALLMNGDAGGAVDVLQSAVRANPDQPMLTCLLGRSYTMLGDADHAREMYQQTLKLDPQNQVAQAMLKQP